MVEYTMMDTAMVETIGKLLAAWLLIAVVALWTHHQGLGLSRKLLFASVRGLLQLLALAFVLHWIFDVQSIVAQAAFIAGFCLLAGHNSASHYDQAPQSWLAATIGLIAGCTLTLPWLAFSKAIADDTRALVPLGSMVAANGMHAISIMYARLQSDGKAGEGIMVAMIPTIDTLRMVGLVHMPGIFVGMVLAGASPFDAAVAQLIVLYMVIASSLTACLVSLSVCNYLKNEPTGF